MMFKDAADGMLALRNKRNLVERRKIGRILLLGATLGGVAGGLAGLLLAPHSGRRTREKICLRTGEAIDRVKTHVAEIKDNIADPVQKKTS